MPSGSMMPVTGSIAKGRVRTCIGVSLMICFSSLVWGDNYKCQATQDLLPASFYESDQLILSRCQLFGPNRCEHRCGFPSGNTQLQLIGSQRVFLSCTEGLTAYAHLYD